MGVYRLELAKSGRAVCKNAECKKNGVKILTGELRFCNLVTIKENQSWQYKHWGCVTPKQLANIKETIEDDLNLLDGYEDLDTESQEKVRNALADGHVDDSDWKGDPEQNRPGKNGFRTRISKKKSKPEMEDSRNEDDVLSPNKPLKNKRGPSDTELNDLSDDPEGDERPAKKARKTVGRKAKPTNDDVYDGSVPKVQKTNKGQSKAQKTEGHVVDRQVQPNGPTSGHDVVPQLPPKKNRGSQKVAKIAETKVQNNDTVLRDEENEKKLKTPKLPARAAVPLRTNGEDVKKGKESEQRIHEARKPSTRQASAIAKRNAKTHDREIASRGDERESSNQKKKATKSPSTLKKSSAITNDAEIDVGVSQVEALSEASQDSESAKKVTLKGAKSAAGPSKRRAKRPPFSQDDDGA